MKHQTLTEGKMRSNVKKYNDSISLKEPCVPPDSISDFKLPKNIPSIFDLLERIKILEEKVARLEKDNYKHI